LSLGEGGQVVCVPELHDRKVHTSMWGSAAEGATSTVARVVLVVLSLAQETPRPVMAFFVLRK